MRLVITFNGEDRRSIAVADRIEIWNVHTHWAVTEGWGRILRGTQAELEAVRAYETSAGGWLYPLGDGKQIFVELVPAPETVAHAKERAAAYVTEFGEAWDDIGDWDSTAFESAPKGSGFAEWKTAFVQETERLAVGMVRS